MDGASAWLNGRHTDNRPYQRRNRATAKKKIKEIDEKGRKRIKLMGAMKLPLDFGCKLRDSRNVY